MHERASPPQHWRSGVTVGKFNPPHLGHRHLIATASERVDQLYVLVGDRADQTLRGEDRAAWLRDAGPSNVTVIVTPDDIPEANEPWAERALELLPTPPDVAFTSESWGSGWAGAMAAEHVAVDCARVAHPISGTDLRADLRGHFDWLVPAARAALTRRIVIVGAESTGKTTLASRLAERLATVWVPEHGRWYWEGRRFLADQSWSADEFRHIASAQAHLEDGLARYASGGVLLADTDPLMTAVWRERYLGTVDPWVDELAAARLPDLYLVCGTDAPWTQDGTRESPQHREAMQERTLERVAESGVDFVVLSGSLEDREAEALEVVARHIVFEPLV